MNTTQIAQICHETNKAYCELLGDDSQKPWNEAEQWQRDSAVRGVEFVLANPGAGPAAQHESWLREKTKDGWIWGPVKDVGKKQHPCYIPYSELPLEQRMKDYLFCSVVQVFINAGAVTLTASVQGHAPTDDSEHLGNTQAPAGRIPDGDPPF